MNLYSAKTIEFIVPSIDQTISNAEAANVTKCANYSCMTSTVSAVTPCDHGRRHRYAINIRGSII